MLFTVDAADFDVYVYTYKYILKNTNEYRKVGYA